MSESYLDDILEKSEKSKVIGEIYVITNTNTKKMYVGQTRSHRMNRGQFRPFGSEGRFKDHVSEAINNKKKKQCTYLNNSIRKHGVSAFEWKRLEFCAIKDLDEMEQKYIAEVDTTFPNGYNLTTGGKSHGKVCHNVQIDSHKPVRKRNYARSEKTKEKMSRRMKIIAKEESRDLKMRQYMTQFHDNKKIELLASLNIELGEHLIRPVTSKITGKVHDYVLRFNKRKLTLYSTTDTIEDKFNRLVNVIEKAKLLRKGNNG